MLAIAFYYIPAYWSFWADIMVSVGSLLLMLFGILLLVFTFVNKYSKPTARLDQYNAYSNQDNFQQQRYSYSGQVMPQYAPAPYTPSQLPESIPTS